MEIIVGADHVWVYGRRGKHAVSAGNVAIITAQGDLLCICKNDKKIIELSIFCHGELADMNAIVHTAT